MTEIWIIIIEKITKPPSIIGIIVLLLVIMLIFKCNYRETPPPVNNSGFNFEKEAQTKFEPSTNTSSTTNQTTPTAGNSITERSQTTNNTQQMQDKPHNLYYCTNHEVYFAYNEQNKHYNCDNSIKIINVKYCWECQTHFTSGQSMNHWGHGETPYDSQKQFYHTFYCNTCGFNHYTTRYK
jgi:hypothetical protein